MSPEGGLGPSSPFPRKKARKTTLSRGLKIELRAGQGCGLERGAGAPSWGSAELWPALPRRGRAAAAERAIS